MIAKQIKPIPSPGVRHSFPAVRFVWSGIVSVFVGAFVLYVVQILSGSIVSYGYSALFIVLVIVGGIAVAVFGDGTRRYLGFALLLSLAAVALLQALLLDIGYEGLLYFLF